MGNKQQFTSLERGEGESFAAYKERRKAVKAQLKTVKRGVLVWDSLYSGTYENRERAMSKGTRKTLRAIKNGKTAT